MRIPSERAESIIGLIGEEHLRFCNCLPDYRERYISFQSQIIEEESGIISNQETS